MLVAMINQHGKANRQAQVITEVKKESMSSEYNLPTHSP